FELQADEIIMLGVTGDRLYHTSINIQTLLLLKQRKVNAIVVDRYNKLELTLPGKHDVIYEEKYPNISFIPMTPVVRRITLEGIYYPLTSKDLTTGSTLCTSNKLLSKTGTFIYE